MASSHLLYLRSRSLNQVLVTVYIRYCQVGFMIKHHNDLKVAKKWNTLGCWSGVLSSAGISMVANFQETNVLILHALGAGMAFGFGTIYLFMQTLISYLIRKSYNKHPDYIIGPKLLYFRVVSTSVCGFLSVVSAIGFLVSYAEFTGESIAWWTEEHGGFQIRLISTFSEWIAGVSLLSYVATLADEFKTMVYEGVRFRNNFLNCDEA